jgi:GNAT superfamily N-acetyltransferase
VALESILVRPVRPDDAAALARMLARCSPRTRYERFHGVVESIPAEYLRRCVAGDRQEARVAELVTGELAGLASTGPVPGEPGVRELGVLVEDRWQRKGIGRLLAADLFAHAASTGVRLVRLELCRLRPDLLDYVVTHLPVASRLTDGCDVTVDVTVDETVGLAVDLTVDLAVDLSVPPLRSAPATAPPPRSSAGRRPGAPART